jgi:hypothetical protein
MLASLVFLAFGGLAQYRPHALAVMVPHQHRLQLVAIESVGLGTPRAPVDLDAGSIDHDVVHAQLSEPAVKPPAVASGFVAAVHPRTRRCLEPLAGAHDAVGGCRLVASGHRVTAHATATVADG